MDKGASRTTTEEQRLRKDSSENELQRDDKAGTQKLMDAKKEQQKNERN